MSEEDGTLGGRHVPIIVSTLIVVLTVIGGFWSLADPRSELKNIRENFLTIREHNEFVSRVTRDITRIESRDEELEKEKANKDDVNNALRAIRERIDTSDKDQMSRNEFMAIRTEIDKQIEHLQTMVNRVETKLHEHAERDADRFQLRPPAPALSR